MDMNTVLMLGVVAAGAILYKESKRSPRNPNHPPTMHDVVQAETSRNDWFNKTTKNSRGMELYNKLLVSTPADVSFWTSTQAPAAKKVTRFGF